MKHIVFHTNDKKSISNAITESQKSIYNKNHSKKSQLLQIFTSITDADKLQKILKKYNKYFPNAIIIGATTAGEIAHAKMQESSTVISLSLFEKTTLKAKYIKKTEHKSGKKLASKLCNEKTKAAIVLSEGLHGEDYVGFIEGFKEEYPDIIVAGGLAGDNFQLEKTLIFLDENIYDAGSVALSLSGKSLFPDNRYNLNWTPIEVDGESIVLSEIEDMNFSAFSHSAKQTSEGLNDDELIKAIFDNQDNIVILASKTKGMLNINRAFFKYFDFKDVNDFKSKHKCVCDLFMDEEGYVHPKKDPNWLDNIAKNERVDYKVKMLSKEKKVHIFKIRIKTIDDNYIINLSDITNLENALKKAYASEQAKSIFLANMSHEIRTPLNGILGFSELLSKKELDRDSARYIDIINKSGQTLLNVVNDILDFSKLESGELALYETETNLFTEMEASVSTFASVSKSKHIDYYTYIDTTLPKTLKCDVQRIKQVINNLTSNAIKFTPEGGKVAVNIVFQKIKKKKAVIFFSVKDSGIGIAKEKLSTVFQAFSQADNSISREFGGTGLGLAISSQYIEMMGSQLKVKSELGVGSEFYFELQLPIVDASENISKEFDITNKNIAILQPETEIECGINEVVESYLKGWMCGFTKINSMQDITEDTDIVIVCAKNFEHEECLEELDRYEKLELIYIEGGDERFSCKHKKFHLIEQPMTGSALFDMIITLTHDTSNVIQTKSESIGKLFDGTVLVAEDNETNQMLISIMLDQRGIEYKIVNNGQEAVDTALEQKYDLILMDVNMPQLDGISATKILREKGYDKPIVSLSANVIEADVISYIEAGVNEALSKPIVPEEFDAVLTKYLREKVEQETLHYDTIDVEKLGNALSLPNSDIILQLLNSFRESAQGMIKKIEQDKLDKDILHTIKGSAGNLRLNELYTLVKQYEDEFSSWREEENLKKSEIVVSHLKNAILNIELLNK